MRSSDLRQVIELLVLAVLLASCESADKKCARLRGTATQLWGSYAGELQADLAATQAALEASKKKLEGEIKQRHEGAARDRANELHGTELSLAWYRTFYATTTAQCSKDPECLELKVQATEGEAKVADLARRISAVRAAVAAAGGKPESAKQAADAIPEDTGRPAFQPARAASAESATVCADAAP